MDSTKQTTLDFGQTLPKIIKCTKCLMDYRKDNADDEHLHSAFHLQYMASSPIKLSSLVANLNEELGFPIDRIGYSISSKLYCYADENKNVLGVCITEKCYRAYKLTNGDKTSKESYPCKCGINRLWVHKDHRRKRIAATLLDTIRSNYLFGHYLTETEIAFSSPTNNGRDFAAYYTNTSDFLVYFQIPPSKER